MFDFDWTHYTALALIAIAFLAGRTSRRGHTHFNRVISEELMTAEQKAAYATVRDLRIVRRDFGPGANLTKYWVEHKFSLPSGYDADDLMTTVDALIARITKQFKLGDMPVPTLATAAA